jgi:hypothetical protein
MDLVEKELGCQYYTSKWLVLENLLWTKYTDKNGKVQCAWMGTTSSKYPSWIGEYKHWLADYIKSDSQILPDDLILNIKPFIWQYAKELMGGFPLPVDVNQVMVTLDEWKRLYSKNIDMRTPRHQN